MMHQYDLVVVGTGAANTVTEMAAQAGLRVALIEKGKFGGTCLTRGCIPTKVMVTAADKVREAELWSTIGLVGTAPKMDWPVIARRVWEKIDESHDLKSHYQQLENVDVYEGTGSFTDNFTLEVKLHSGETVIVQGKKIVLGVGARSTIPNVVAESGVAYWSSENFFGEDFPQELPESLIVLGGGPIGTEFAHALATAGVKVTIIQHNRRLLPKEEPEISAWLAHQFEEFGVQVVLNQEITRVFERADKKVVVVEDRETGETAEVEAAALLVATGITPNSDLLHLENTDIHVDSRGYIVTNEFLETSVDGIYALGDINGQPPFRHKANYEADIIGHNLWEVTEAKEYRWARYSTVPVVTYTYPQVAHVGMTEEEARKSGREVAIGTHYYSDTAKGFALGMEKGSLHDGFIKLVVDATSQEVLGAHIVGPEASILLQPFVNLLNAGATELEVIHPEIGSEEVQALRQQKPVRAMNPRLATTISETMTPHPSLMEVPMWTRYYFEKKA